MSEILVKGYKCERCGHKWIPRKEEKPRRCPKCKSAYHDVPRKVHMDFSNTNPTFHYSSFTGVSSAT